MSQLKDETKYAIFADLASSIQPSEIAEVRKVPYATVLRLKREFDTARENNKLAELLDFNDIALKQLAAQTLANTPAELQDEVAQGLSTALEKLDLAKTLQSNLQSSANVLTERVNILARQVQTPGDLLILAEVLSLLQNAFFNKNLTQVNVQNNFGQQAANGTYSEFLSDGRAQ